MGEKFSSGRVFLDTLPIKEEKKKGELFFGGGGEGGGRVCVGGRKGKEPKFSIAGEGPLLACQVGPCVCVETRPDIRHAADPVNVLMRVREKKREGKVAQLSITSVYL